jgi:hypothetical protein
MIGLAADGDRRRALAAAVKKFARPDAAAVIVDKAMALVGRFSAR